MKIISRCGFADCRGVPIADFRASRVCPQATQMRLLPLFKLPHVGQFITIRRASLFQISSDCLDHVSGVTLAGMIPQFNHLSAIAVDAPTAVDHKLSTPFAARWVPIDRHVVSFEHPLTVGIRDGSIETRVRAWGARQISSRSAALPPLPRLDPCDSCPRDNRNAPYSPEWIGVLRRVVTATNIQPCRTVAQESSEQIAFPLESLACRFRTCQEFA